MYFVVYVCAVGFLVVALRVGGLFVWFGLMVWIVCLLILFVFVGLRIRWLYFLGGIVWVSGWLFRILVVCLMFVGLFVMGFSVRFCDACVVVCVFVCGWWFKLEVCS